MHADEKQAAESIDWVKAVDDAAIDKLFRGLAAAVAQDVDRRNALNDPTVQQSRFWFKPDGETYFATGRELPKHTAGEEVERPTVRFFLRNDTIEITEGFEGKKPPSDALNLKVTVDINDYGNWRFVIARPEPHDGYPVEGWQLRQLVLERLFFGRTMARWREAARGYPSQREN